MVWRSRRGLVGLIFGVAALETVCAEGGSGFPCAADEWVVESWHPPEEVTCHSCYECEVGQVCLERGGCFNCSAGEYDSDRNPTHECVPCPVGKTSEERATACTEVEQDVLELTIGAWSTMDTWLQAVCGTGLGALVLGVATWCCRGCRDGIRGLCREVRKQCGCEDEDGDRANAPDECSSTGANEAGIAPTRDVEIDPKRDDASLTETNGLITGATRPDEQTASGSFCCRFFRCHRGPRTPRAPPGGSYHCLQPPPPPHFPPPHPHAHPPPHPHAFSHPPPHPQPCPHVHPPPLPHAPPSVQPQPPPPLTPEQHQSTHTHAHTTQEHQTAAATETS